MKLPRGCPEDEHSLLVIGILDKVVVDGTGAFKSGRGWRGPKV